MRSIASLVLAAVLGTTSAPSLARADRPPSFASVARHGPTRGDVRAARRHFAAGRRLIAKGAYAAATTELEAAHQLDPQPGHLFNLGVAHHLGGQRSEAILYYQRYLDAAPTGTEASQARAWLAELRAQIAAEVAEARRAELARKETAARLAALAHDVAAREAAAEAARAPVDVPAPDLAHVIEAPPARATSDTGHSTRRRLAAATITVGAIVVAAGIGGHDLDRPKAGALIGVGSAAVLTGVVLATF